MLAWLKKGTKSTGMRTESDDDTALQISRQKLKAVCSINEFCENQDYLLVFFIHCRNSESRQLLDGLPILAARFTCQQVDKESPSPLLFPLKALPVPEPETTSVSVSVNVTVPETRPVTTPALVTVPVPLTTPVPVITSVLVPVLEPVAIAVSVTAPVNVTVSVLVPAA